MNRFWSLMMTCANLFTVHCLCSRPMLVQTLPRVVRPGVMLSQPHAPDTSIAHLKGQTVNALMSAGVASNGAGQLAGIDLDDAEWQAFGAGIARLARERERRPNDFDHFLQVTHRCLVIRYPSAYPSPAAGLVLVHGLSECEGSSGAVQSLLFVSFTCALSCTGHRRSMKSSGSTLSA